MNKNELADSEVANRLGCSTSAISKLRLRYGRPSLERAYEIERLTDGEVGLKDWIYEPRNRERETERWLKRRRLLNRAQRIAKGATL